MGRGVSAGGGQSSLGYLFGGGEAPPAPAPTPSNPQAPPPTEAKASNSGVAPKPTAVSSPPADSRPQVPAGIHSSNANNYVRADGQNCGNFLTERPSTKVHAAPGGDSSLGYLFGDGKK